MRTFVSFLLLCYLWPTVQSNGQSKSDWKMVVSATDCWSYFEGRSEPPTNWKQPDFNDSNWLQSPLSVGMGDKDDSTQIEKVHAVYLRINFEIIDTSQIHRAVLHADYDDAFVAYWNGQEIARANVGVAGQSTAFDDKATYHREAQLYKGGQAEYFLLNLYETRASAVMGKNTLAVHLINRNIKSSDLSGFFNLSLQEADSNNRFRAVPDWFEPPIVLESSKLPIIKINTFGQPILNDPRIKAHMQVINSENGINDVNTTEYEYDGQISIEIRGSSSRLRFPKKSYSIETQKPDGNNNNVSLLGMPKENDWILYGPYADKSMMRNALLYHLVRQMGQYAPRTRWVELLLNNKYEGVYLLVEKIKRNKNRVDIARNQTNDTSGGYIIKIDKKNGGGGAGWHSVYTAPQEEEKKIYFQYEYPKHDDISEQQKAYIQNFVEAFEHSLCDDGFKHPQEGYRRYIDTRSFIDFFLANELAFNVDGYRLSTFLHKESTADGGKLKMGPVWDFNLSFGCGYDCKRQNQYGFMKDYNTKCEGKNFHIPFWWDRLLEDPAFRQELICRWEELRTGPLATDTILKYIDESAAYLEDAQARNYVRWPILKIKMWPNLNYGKSFQAEVDIVKQWLMKRIEWLDKMLVEENLTTNTPTVR